jgi:hypothetical protein
MSMDVLVIMLVLVYVDRLPLPTDIELRRADPCTNHGLGPDSVWGDREASKRPPDIVERHTSVDERAQNHVSGRTGEAVEVENVQDLPSYSSRSRLRWSTRLRHHPCLEQ